MKIGSVVKTKTNQAGNEDLYYITDFSGFGHAKISSFSKASNPAPGAFIRAEYFEFCSELRVVGHIEPDKKIRKVFWLQDDGNYHRPSRTFEFSIDSFFEFYNPLPHKDIRYSTSDIHVSESDNSREYKIAEYSSDSIDMFFLLIFPTLNRI